MFVYTILSFLLRFICYFIPLLTFRCVSLQLLGFREMSVNDKNHASYSHCWNVGCVFLYVGMSVRLIKELQVEEAPRSFKGWEKMIYSDVSMYVCAYIFFFYFGNHWPSYLKIGVSIECAALKIASESVSSGPQHISRIDLFSLLVFITLVDTK